MPTKPNHAGYDQEYVPAGNGDASGEYADNVTGSNAHYKSGKTPNPYATKAMAKKKVSATPKEIKNSYEGLNKNKIGEASPEEQKKIIKAIKTVNSYPKDIEKAEEMGKEKTEGIWKNDPTIAELVEIQLTAWGNVKLAIQGIKDSIEAKKDYFSVNGMEEKLQKVSEYEKKINDYIDAKKKIDAKYEKAKSLLEEYENPDDVYSQKRKDNAVWCKSIAESKKKFTGVEKIKSITEKEKEALISYTGSYSSINNPLRGIGYEYSNMNPEKKGQFIKKVKAMTSAIDKCKLGFDAWVQRGTNQINLPGGGKLDYNISSGKLAGLVGTSFKDHGFVSAGAAKDTGFTTKGIIMNIYCPKGTKGAYVENISEYDDENEIILQRGYTYNITKAERKDGQIYIDCDVVLDSDEDKYDDEELEQLKQAHF